MKITKAVITAAGKKQRTLPLQTLIDRDGTEKSVLEILIEESLIGWEKYELEGMRDMKDNVNIIYASTRQIYGRPQ